MLHRYVVLFCAVCDCVWGCVHLLYYHMQHGRVPLHYAANSGRVGAVKALVSEFHCPVDYRDAVSTMHSPHCACTVITYIIHTSIK